jgi:hypothetical protein
VDGTKIRANNSHKHNHNKTTVERELTRIDKQISEYLSGMEMADEQEQEETRVNEEAIHEALKKLKERKIRFEDLHERLEGADEVSTVDADSRLMRQGGDSRLLNVCYNVQTVVDEKYKLIVDFDVIQRSDDKGNLHHMASSAKEIMGGEEDLTVLADKGYYDGEDIAKCEGEGITCLVSKPASGGVKPSTGFSHEDFRYEKETDSYVCPCQQELRFMRFQKNSNEKEYRIYANYSACTQCVEKRKCTQAKYRQIWRLPYQDVLDKVDKQTHANKALYRSRQEIVEHPFGTIKAIWGYKQYLCCSKPKVTAETALTYLAYNLRRLISILGEHTERSITAIA